MKLDLYDVNRAELRMAVEAGASRANRGKVPKRVALILAATLLVSAGALSVGSRYIINWDGAKVESRTRTPTPEEEDRWEEMERMWGEMVQDAPNDEYWYLGAANSGSMHKAPLESHSSVSEIEQRVRNSHLLLPAAAPKDVVYSFSTLSFCFTPETYRATQVYSEQDMGNGIMLRKARPPKEYFDRVGGYSIYYAFDGEGPTPDEDRVLSIQAEYVIGRSSGLGLDDAEQYEAVSIEGVAKALYVEGDGKRALFLLQTNIPRLMSVTAFDFGSNLDPEPVNSAMYTIQTNTLTKQELIAFAETLS